MPGVDYSLVKSVQQGESPGWTADVANVSASDLLAKAWLMLKTDVSVADGSATLSKAITPSNVAGTGQIVLTAGGKGALRFDVAATDTAALSARDYLYFIKVETAAGATAYIECGVFRVSPAGITST